MNDLVDRASSGQPRPLDGRPDRHGTQLHRRHRASAPPNFPIGVRAALTR